MPRRQVDRDANVVRPVGGDATGLAHDPFAERDNQASVFRNGDEFGRRNHAAGRVLPAHQRFKAGDLFGFQAVLRLEEHVERISFQRHPKVSDQFTPGTDDVAHLFFEEPIGIAPVGLGFVQRQIRLFEDLVAIDRYLMGNRDADAHSNHNLFIEHRIGHGDFVDNRLSELVEAIAHGHQVGDDGKLITAQP